MITEKDSAVDLIMEIIPRLMQSFATSVRAPGVGLSPAHFRILHMLEHHPMTMGDMARKQFISKPSLCDSVNLLVDKGWVEKEKDEKDQRKIILKLSEKGVNQINTIHRLMHDQIKLRLGNASDEDLRILSDGLKKIRDLMIIS